MTETITRRIPAAVPLALVAVVGWVVLEIAARVGFAVVGTVVLRPVVGDSTGAGIAGSFVALVVGFPLVALLLSRYALRAGQTRSDWDYEWDARTVGLGIGAGLLVLGIGLAVNEVDVALFGTSEAAGTALADTLEAAPWIAAALLVGNGVVVPAAEERVWRGIVQTDLVDRWGVVAGILATAVLFSLKHAVVDGSLGRLFMLVALGVGWGVIRHRWGTGASTAAHVAGNLVSTSLMIVSVLG